MKNNLEHSVKTCSNAFMSEKGMERNSEACNKEEQAHQHSNYVHIHGHESKIKKMENNLHPALTNVDFCVVTHFKEETIPLSEKLIFY